MSQWARSGDKPFQPAPRVPAFASNGFVGIMAYLKKRRRLSLIVTLTYGFARIGAALKMLVEDLQSNDLLQIEWVKWGGFSQVECDSKGFFVNRYRAVW
jgi:hypothetical protein